jgi:hypothetical protein
MEDRMQIRKIAMAAAIILSAQTTALAEPAGEEFHLICEGEKIVSAPASQTSAIITASNGAYASGSSVTSHSSVMPMTVQFRLKTGVAEINAQGRWTKVKNLVVNNDEINGKIGSWWLGTGQSFHIDRRTGRITTEGTYHGDCRQLDKFQRKF